MITSENLTFNLANKLKTNISHNSIIYQEKWVEKHTPDNIVYVSHSASSKKTPTATPTASNMFNSLFEESDDNTKIVSGYPTPRTVEIDEDYDSYIDRMQNSKHKQNQGKTQPNNVSMTAQMIGWPTPCASDNKDRGTWDNPCIQRRVEIGKSIELSMLATSATDVKLSGYPTPQSRDWKGSSGRSIKGSELDMPTVAELAGWATPIVENTSGSRYCYGKLLEDGTKEKIWKLPGQVDLIVGGWATPNTMDSMPPRSPQALYNQARNGGRTGRTFPANLREQVDENQQEIYQDALRDAEINVTDDNYTAPVSSGRLNPRLSGWLMGYPSDWCASAITAYRGL